MTISRRDGPAGQSAFVMGLRTDLEKYLRQLDTERQAVGRAIRALDDVGPRRSDARSLRDAVLEAIVRHPGVRATMLALTLGRAQDEVIATVHALERDGLVARSGMGWTSLQ